MNRAPIAAGLGILLLASCASNKSKHDFPITFHAEGSAAEAPKLAFHDTAGDPPRTVYWRTLPEVTHQNIEAFFPFPAQEGDGSGAYFVMSTQGKLRLHNFTQTKQGELMLAMVNKQKNDVFWIEKPITDGILFVTQGISDEMLEHMREHYVELPERPGPREASDTEAAGYNIMDELAR